MKNSFASQKIDVYLYMQKYITKGTDGYVEYTHGMTDQRIAKHFNTSLWCVQNLRRERFGKRTADPFEGERQGASSVDNTELVMELIDQQHRTVMGLEEVRKAISALQVRMDDIQEAQKRLRNMAGIIDMTPNSI